MTQLNGAVVVIAGASSGIGRAAAQAFAARGARLVLAARRADTLGQVAAECARLGAESLVQPTDVTEMAQVAALAEAAIARFGRIDVWINNAGIGAVGAWDEVPMAAHERVVRTNLLGAMHGAYAVLPHFRQRGRGVIINTNSVGAWVPSPYAAAYAAGKHGLRGFAESLRAELADQPGIHVCDVLPAFVDTPGLSHGANYTGRRIGLPPGALSPFDVADAMVEVARRPRATRPVGLSARLARLAHAVSPAAFRWGMGRFLGAYLHRAAPAPETAGNLFEAPDSHGIYGGTRRPPPRREASGPGKGTALAVGKGTALAVGGTVLGLVLLNRLCEGRDEEA